MQIGVALRSVMHSCSASALFWVLLLGCGLSLSPAEGATGTIRRAHSPPARDSWQCKQGAYQISGTISPLAADAGSTVTLSGAASTSVSLNSSGFFSLACLANGTYTVTPSKAGYTFSPSSQTVSINGSSVTNTNFTPTTSASGGGTCTNSAPPVLAGTQSLDPNVDNDSPGQAEAFQVTGAACGVVNSLNLYLDTSSAASTVVVGLYSDNGGTPGTLLTQGTTTTPAAGSWNTISVPPVNVSSGTPYWIAVLGTTGGSPAFRDAPFGCTSVVSESMTLTSLPSTWTSGASYPSCPLSAYAGSAAVTSPAPVTYSISGAISPSADAAGSVVSLGGSASATTAPDANGNYSFGSLANGSYNVSLSNSLYTFTPDSQQVIINGANLTGVNFSAAAVVTNPAPTYSISGVISPPSAAAGAVVTLSGAANATATPDASGIYSFTGLANGSYSVTPSSQLANFSPASNPVTVAGANVSAVNFGASGTANTIFYDDFTGTSLSSAWTVIRRHGEYSQSETECNTAGAVSVSDSLLTITTSATAAVCGDSRVPAGIYPAYPGTAASSFPYTTGDIQWSNFNFTYGTITFRAKFPPVATNTWPAIWMLGANCQASNPATGNTSYNGDSGVGNCPNFSAGYEEEDLVECAVNEAGPGKWCHFAFWGGGAFGFCNINLDSDWHVFQFVWKPNSITEYLDGSQVCQISARAALQIPQQPMFLIIQTQTGGIGGTPNNASLPATLQVDYVKVTQP